jgi:dolichol-phosphate mannosyltransferase
LSILLIPVVILIRLLTKIELTGQATTLVAVLFLGGVQLISLGILGEYLGRVYDEVKGRPLYVVSQAPEDAPVGILTDGSAGAPNDGTGSHLTQEQLTYYGND